MQIVARERKQNMQTRGRQWKKRTRNYSHRSESVISLSDYPCQRLKGESYPGRSQVKICVRNLLGRVTTRLIPKCDPALGGSRGEPPARVAQRDIRDPSIGCWIV